MYVRVLFAAHDAGPTKAFFEIMQTPEELFPILYTGTKGPLPNDNALRQQIAGVDVVLVGLSSAEGHHALEAKVAAFAAQMHTPLACFSDTFGAWNRWWCRDTLLSSHVLFVVSAREVSSARRMFPNARVVAVGNPAWGDYLTPKERSEVRERLGYAQKERVYLAPGTKNPVVNILLWSNTLHALKALRGERRLLLAPHPGDTTDHALYERLVHLSPGIRVEFLPKGCTTDDVVPGVDAVVHTGNSSTGVHALCRGIPVIDCPAPLIDEYIAQETGGWNYTPYKIGVTLHPRASDFAGALAHLSAPRAPFTTLRPGQSVQTILSTLRALVS